MSKNFTTLYKAVKEYPYSTPFKVADVMPGWDNLTATEKADLQREFAVYACDSWDIEFTKDVDEIQIPTDFDFSYKKDQAEDIENFRDTEDVFDLALALLKVPNGRQFIIPQLARECANDYNSPFQWFTFKEEEGLNELINAGEVPYIEIVGETHRFTIYKKVEVKQ